MENQRIMISGFIGGLVAALFSSIPFINFINCFCCLGIMLGGSTALLYYDRSSRPMNYIQTAQALTIGITAGLIGAFLSILFDWIIYLKFGHWDIRLLQSLVEQLEEIPEYLEELFSELDRESASGFLWASTLFTNLLIYPIFCLIGSLLTRLILNRKYPHP